MKIVFIPAPAYKNSNQVYPPLGLLSIASYLLKKRIILKKNILFIESALVDPLESLQYFKPDIIAFSAFTFNYSDAVRIAKNIRKKINCKLIIGGIHISSCPENLDNIFDIGVIGEGEETFLELVKIFQKYKDFPLIKLKDIKGIIFHSLQKTLIVTPIRPLIKQLDKLLPFSWEILPEIYFSYEVVRINQQWQKMKVAYLYTSRGCPYKCIFCSRSILREGLRLFNITKISQEIARLVKQHHVQAIRLIDDTFSSYSKSRIRQFIRELKKVDVLGKIVFIFVFCRTDNINEELINLFKQLGIIDIFFGFESGSNKMLSYLKGDTTTVAINKRAVELIEERGGIGIRGNVMLGSPGESINDLKKSLSFIKWLRNKKCVNDFSPSATTPFPGSMLWKYALKQGIVNLDMDWDQLLWTYDKPKLYFNKSLSYTEFNKAWLKIEKWREIHRKLIRNTGDWNENYRKVRLFNNRLIKNYKLRILLSNFKKGNLLFVLKSIICKVKSRISNFVK